MKGRVRRAELSGLSMGVGDEYGRFHGDHASEVCFVGDGDALA